MKLKNIAFIVFSAVMIAVVGSSCGTKKTAVADTAVSASDKVKGRVDGKKESNAAALEQLNYVRRVSDNAVYADNIVSKIKFSLNTGKNDITVAGSLRMKKDEVIRIQITPLGIMEAGRLEFTKDYVLLVDRIHKEYVKASYSDVDFLQKNGLDFYALQALFWNQLILPGEKEVTKSNLKKFDVNLNAAGNEVPVTVKNGYMAYAWNTSRENGRITSADVNYQSSQHGTSRLHVDYSKFKSVGVKMFPATQVMSFMTTATQKKQEMKLILNLNEVKTDSNWSTQTEISKKYKQVSPEEALRKIMSI